MRVAVVVRPKHAVPPEAMPGLVEMFVAWRETYRSKMESFEFFVGGGGFGVVRLDDEAELHQMILEFPFGPFSDIESRPVVDGDKALAQLRDRIAAMASG